MLNAEFHKPKSKEINMVRPPCCDKQNVKRGLWSAEEDAKILEYVSKHGTGNWTAVPKRAGCIGGLRRCGKSCRLRWTNYLRPDLKHENFTPKEEELIVRLHAAIGSRWSIIAQQLPGRTDNDVKNYWNTKLRKKLSEMGIDPVTHKPFSQILADYGNIGGLPKSGMRIGSLNKDLKNAILMKTEPFSFPPSPQGLSNLNNTHLIPTLTFPKAEPTHQSLFNQNQSNNSSLDLLAQLEAIKLVTEASNCNNYESKLPNFYTVKPTLSSTSPSSSSSTCTSSAVQQKSPIAFDWNDFLLEDEFLPSNPQQQENMVELSSSEILTQTLNQTPQGLIHSETAIQKYKEAIGIDNKLSSISNEVHDTSSCDSSFVEAMLARDDEMVLDFPQLLEEPFYY